jgi:hypothetical protein
MKLRERFLHFFLMNLKEYFILIADSDTEERVVCNEKDADCGQLGNSMHQSLHISDKFERTAASPDLFDSVQDNLPEEPCPPVRPPDVVVPIATTESIEEQKKSTPQDLTFEMDDSLAECLIACTEKVETDLRLSQQQNAAKPVTTGNLMKKANNSLRGGQLQVGITSPKKKTQLPKPTAGSSKGSIGTEFTPKWMENIKNATSPVQFSFKAPSSGDKHFHRTLFGNLSSKESQVVLNKSVDPFEDSFETDLDQVLAAEVVALSQMASVHKEETVVIKPGPPVPTGKLLQIRVPTFSKAALKPVNSTFKRHHSTPLLVAPQAKSSEVSAPISKPQNSSYKPVQTKQQQGSAIPCAVDRQKKLAPFPRHKSGDMLGKKTPVASTVKLLSAAPLLRHRSSDFGQVASACEYTLFDADLFDKICYISAQKCSQQEIERKRLEAKKRLASRKQSGHRDGI